MSDRFLLVWSCPFPSADASRHNTARLEVSNRVLLGCSSPSPLPLSHHIPWLTCMMPDRVLVPSLPCCHLIGSPPPRHQDVQLLATGFFVYFPCCGAFDGCRRSPLHLATPKPLSMVRVGVVVASHGFNVVAMPQAILVPMFVLLPALPVLVTRLCDLLLPLLPQLCRHLPLPLLPRPSRHLTVLRKHAPTYPTVSHKQPTKAKN